VISYSEEDTKVIKLHFDFEKSWNEYDEFYLKSKDFYKILFEIKSSLESETFVKVKYMSFNKSNLKFGVTNKNFAVKSNMEFKYEDLETGNLNILKRCYAK